MLDFLLGGDDHDGISQIEMGSIGWEDEDDFYFPGDTDNDGHTLVRVQLFKGRDVTKPINKTRAQGMKIVCQVSSGVVRVPSKDSRVFVIIPKGMEYTPGAGVIVAAVEKLPQRAGNIQADEMCIVGPDGSAGRVVLKKDGTVAMCTNLGNDETANSITLAVSPKGFKFSSPFGSIVLDSTGFHVKTAAGPRIDMGGISIPGLPDWLTGAVTGYCTITAPQVKCAGGIVWLGVGDTWNTAISAPFSAYKPGAAPVTTGTPYQLPHIRFATG